MELSKNKRAQYLRFINMAADIGQNSKMKIKMGSLLVYNKTIISSGFNEEKTHPVQKKYSHLRPKRIGTYVHAEVACTNKVREVPEGSILFIARRYMDGKLAMARPCPSCMNGAIRNKGIRQIVYSTLDGFAVEFID
jgi:deoxycytidylate deaminase